MSLKIWLLKNGVVQKVRLLSTLQDHEDRLKALEEGNVGEEESTDSSDNSSTNITNDPSTESSSTTPLDTQNLSFTVKYTDGTPVPSQVIFLDNDYNNYATTGSAGGCSLNNISNGEHIISSPDNIVEINGETTSDKSIQVSENNTHFELIIQN